MYVGLGFGAQPGKEILDTSQDGALGTDRSVLGTLAPGGSSCFLFQGSEALGFGFGPYGTISLTDASSQDGSGPSLTLLWNWAWDGDERVVELQPGTQDVSNNIQTTVRSETGYDGRVGYFEFKIESVTSSPTPPTPAPTFSNVLGTWSSISTVAITPGAEGKTGFNVQVGQTKASEHSSTTTDSWSQSVANGFKFALPGGTEYTAQVTSGLAQTTARLMSSTFTLSEVVATSVYCRIPPLNASSPTLGRVSLYQ